MEKPIKYLVEEKGNNIDFILLIKIILQNFKFFSLVSLTLLTVFIIYIFGTNKVEYMSNYPISINSTVNKNIINDLKNAAKFSNQELINNIECTSDELEGLNFIQISNISDKNDIYSATISINSTNADNQKLIVDKLINWSATNPKVESIINTKKQNLKTLIDKTEEQLIEIKKIKEIYLSTSLAKESEFSFIEEYKILETKYELNEQMEELNHIIAFSSQIYKPLDDKNSSKLLPIFLSILTSIILSVLITIIYNYSKNKTVKPN